MITANFWRENPYSETLVGATASPFAPCSPADSCVLDRSSDLVVASILDTGAISNELCSKDIDDIWQVG